MSGLPPPAPLVCERHGVRQVYSPWTTDEAAKLVGSLRRFMKDRGYVAALYGSSLDGRGRDLDLMVVQGHVGAIAAADLLHELKRELKAEEVADQYYGLFGVVSVLLKLPDGRLIDVAVYRLNRTAT